MNLPYNYTSYPNYLGHRTQKEASISWESSLFPALVQTNCYKYLMFFACTVLVPKCDVSTGQRVPPCRALCEHSKERCESVLGIVGLQWPEDTDCNQFPEENSDNQTCLMPDEYVEGQFLNWLITGVSAGEEDVSDLLKSLSVYLRLLVCLLPVWPPIRLHR
nr:atrial natriuretic peptide-converting enzyme-like [Microcebus murinus]